MLNGGGGASGGVKKTKKNTICSIRFDASKIDKSKLDYISIELLLLRVDGAYRVVVCLSLMGMIVADDCEVGRFDMLVF